MNTLVVPAAQAEEAVQLLRSGEPVGLPTETVYGLAADALNPEAVARIFEAKERPFFDPLIVHLPDASWLSKLARNVPELAMDLLEAYWPGPFTILLPRTALVPDLVTAGMPEVALRMSAHPLFREVCAAFGGPLAAPSANRFGRISPTSAAHVKSELDGRIPLILDGGPTAHGIESTIVRVRGKVVEFLRAGPVTAEEIEAQFGVGVRYARPVGNPEAPGQLPTHYAPRTPLQVVEKAEQWRESERAALLAWDLPEEDLGFELIELLSPSGHNLREAATRLFACLRRLDESGVDRIIAEQVPEEGVGRAIMDRLRRAEFRSESSPGTR